ncbi:hypothetical protein Tco_0218918 [Tanacetum coccineum]
MLVEMIAERKKFFASQRAAEQRSKPPTKTQIRNRMCAYLKILGGIQHKQLKGKEILIEKTWRPSGSWLKLNMGIQGQRRIMKECDVFQKL